jgi:hypothetical protein
VGAVNNVSASSSIPQFWPGNSAGTPAGAQGDAVAIESSRGGDFASQMLALLSAESSAGGVQVAGVSASAPSTDSSVTLTSLPSTPEAGLSSSAALASARAFLRGRLSAASRTGMTLESQASWEALALRESPSSPDAATAVVLAVTQTTTQAALSPDQVTPLSGGAPGGLPPSGDAARNGDKTGADDTQAAGILGVSVPATDAPGFAATQVMSSAPQSGGAAVVEMRPFESATRMSQANDRATSAMAASSDIETDGQARSLVMRDGGPTAARPAGDVAAGSRLAFAASLNDGTASASGQSTLQPGTSIQAASDPATAARGAASSQSSPAAIPSEPDAQRAAVTPAANYADDDKSRGGSGDSADMGRPNDTSSGVATMSATRSEGNSVSAAQKPAATAQASSTVESAKDQEEISPARPLREIAIRVATDTTQSADVRMLERNGEIHVFVRASDPALASSLRGNVDSLVSNLSLDGISAEVWHPGVAAQGGANADSRHGESGDPSANYQRAEQHSQQSGGQGGGREQRHKPAWLDELE